MLIESVTHPGLFRANNEDRFLARTFEDGSVLFALSDGMGGHAAGEMAAEIAMQALGSFDSASIDPLRDLVVAVHNANKTILEASSFDQSLMGMGTTLTAAFISGRTALWVQIGDSRLYHLRRGVLQQVTCDDTIPGALLKRGKISSEMARIHPYGSMLLKCLGCRSFEPETGTLGLDPGDLLMLSSDGLHDAIPHSELESVLALDVDLRQMLEILVEKCLDAGGSDNITGILAKI